MLIQTAECGIRHLDQTLSEVFPLLIAPETELWKKNITLRALLTMTSGLATEGPDTGLFDESKHLVPAILELPMRFQHEWMFQYTESVS